MTHQTAHPDAAEALQRSALLLDVLIAQLHDVVAATDEAARGIAAGVQGIDTASGALREASAQLGPHPAAARVGGVGEELAARTTEVLGHLQFQDVTRQSLESVVRALHGLRHQVEALAGASGDHTSQHFFEDALEALEATYVSDRQRAVHAAATGGAAPEALADIELF